MVIYDNLLTKNAVVHSAWKMALTVKRHEFFHYSGEREREREREERRGQNDEGTNK